MEFILKAILAGLIVSSASWLAGRSPALAGFLVALPISTAILLPIVYFEQGSAGEVNQLARSVAIAVPLTLSFFLPFFLTLRFEMNFWLTYGLGFFALGIAFIAHRWITSWIESQSL